MANICSVKPTIPAGRKGHSPRITRNLSKTTANMIPSSSFTKLSLEIRDMIYRMLLTTAYCTDIDSKRRIVRFRLHTAILLVNKQISAEASRVLYHQNHFVIFRANTVTIRASEIPTFRYFPQDKIKEPLMEVVLDSADNIIQLPIRTQTVITTPNGLQSMISAIWGGVCIERSVGSGDELAVVDVYEGELKVSMKFNLKSQARYETFSELVLKPWKTVHGIKELVLSGNITGPMAQQLTSCMTQGPFSNDIPKSFEQYRLIAETQYKREDYDASRWAWAVLCDYFQYLYYPQPPHCKGRRLVEPGNEYWQALKAAIPFLVEGRLGLGKVDLRQSLYQLATDSEASVSIWNRLKPNWTTVVANFNYKTTNLTQMKLHLCISLNETALGKPEDGLKSLKHAAFYLYQSGRYHGQSENEILKQLKSALNDVLIQRKSVWRCGRKWPLSTRRKSGKGYEVLDVGHSFWDFLDEPEDLPCASGAEKGTD